MTKNIAVIPARGGSKRIPKKNMKDFMGKPMIAYAIEAAQKSKLFDEIMVSTDCEEITNIAKKYGAKVPFMRSDKNASDYATTTDVLFEVLDTYKEQGIEFENLCCIYPCVPFLTGAILQEAYSQFTGFESLMPVCKYPVPVEWALQIDKGYLHAHNKEALEIRSQDLIDKYYDVGMFYYSTTKAFYTHKNLLSAKTKAFIMDEIHVQDIDNESDWKMAELKYRILHEL